ncbi:MAG: arginine N-succinyltransferase, partial [Deltaproteobacteria bacterium]|nr:arginine N-succinyltransferase [Deltaproteobacteria bacterium]
KPMEEQVLNTKLRAIGIDVQKTRKDEPPLEPEPYSEDGARREIEFSEREVNAILARNTDLAQKLAIDLSDDLISAKLLVPMEKDFPMLGGKTMRVTAGVKLAYKNSRPVVVLKGISVMGVPVPNAWLGNMKNVDLVREFGTEQGFWKAFADGVEDIHVEDGRLVVKLKE